MKRLVTKCAACFAVAASLCMTARADDATKRAKLHEMFELAHIDQSISLVFAAQQKQIPRLLQQIVPAKSMTPEQQADLNAFVEKVSGIVQQAASWQKLEPQFTDIYAAAYSEQEIDGLIAFYKSPVGQQMVAKQPEIIQQSQAITQGVLAEVQPQIMQAALQFAQQMKAKYPDAK